MSSAAEFQREMKRLSGRGRCLHFEKGDRCNEIISAHSIQKRGQLSLIAEEGHVYRLIVEQSNLKKSRERVRPKRIGLNKVSTFAGFCKYHDNALFKPIDESPLVPDNNQVALYAYLCLCREYFVKENAVQLFQNLRNRTDITPRTKRLFQESLEGHSVGFEGLMHHKTLYDRALQSGSFHEFEYTIFCSKSICSLQLSGVLYPDFDFEGTTLQHLGHWDSPLDLITYFTAPTDDGWAFGFAWHKSSNQTCKAFVGSLASCVSAGKKIEDTLLRFSLSCCENHAFRISWWDGLPDSAKSELLDRMNLMVSPFIPVPPTYLTEGCRGMANWAFDYVRTTLPTDT